MSPVRFQKSSQIWGIFTKFVVITFLVTPAMDAFADNLMTKAAQLRVANAPTTSQLCEGVQLVEFTENVESTETEEECDFDLILEDVSEVTQQESQQESQQVAQDKETQTIPEKDNVGEDSIENSKIIETEQVDKTDKTGETGTTSEIVENTEFTKDRDVTPKKETQDIVTYEEEIFSEWKLREDAIVRAIRTARPAVVNIRGEKIMKQVSYDATQGMPSVSNSGDSQHVNGMGTGILFDPRGYIVTNFHVVDGIQEIHVTTANTKTYVAEILACDRDTDLAIIKIEALAGEVFETIHLGDSDDLMTGETVITVGNAFGYEHTVTKGIISALHRSVQVSDVQFYEDLIQTDASINPGNSGGPLLNINGKMIGINVAVRAGAQGIGFAIPTNRAMEIVTKMIESYNAEKNWHGIHFVSIPTRNAQGAVVQHVEANSPADAIGLRPGDTILTVNKQKIVNDLDFACAIMELKAGETIHISVSRNNKTATVRLAMGAVSVKNRTASTYAPERKGRPEFQPTKLTTEEIIWKQLGVLAAPVSGNSISVQGTRKYNGGLLVQNVRVNSPAARQGIRNGDILLGILRWETLSLDNVVFVLNQPELQQRRDIKFLVVRNGKVLIGHFATQDFSTETVAIASMK